MVVTVAGFVISVNKEQFSKVLSLIVVTFSPSVTLFSAVQPLKLYAPMDSTELGITIFGKFVQSSKAFDSILMTFVISTDFMLLQS